VGTGLLSWEHGEISVSSREKEPFQIFGGLEEGSVVFEQRD
jgi:hypothetical protein